MRIPLGRCFVTAAGGCVPRAPQPQPRGGNARTLIHAPRFGLAPVRSPLLGGSLFDFPSSGYLDVSVPPVALPFGIAGPRLLGSPIRAPRDLRLSAAPPGLSRLPAPFFGSPRQGIRRAPFTPSGIRPGAPGHRMCPGWKSLWIPARSLELAFLATLCGSQGARGGPRGPAAAGGGGKGTGASSP